MDIDIVADLEATLASDKRFAAQQHKALVSLCRLLASQIEAADKPSTHLTSSYLSALKDLNRILTADRKAVDDDDDNRVDLASIRGSVPTLRSA